MNPLHGVVKVRNGNVSSSVVLIEHHRTILKHHADIGPVDCTLVGGNVVISVDYFKRVVAGLRTIVGGRITTYESLLERARREAILRMKEDAKAKGARFVVNVKLETASITKGRQQQVGAVEVYAYGTALTTISAS